MIAALSLENMLSWLVQVTVIAAMGALLPALLRIRHPRSQLAYYHAILVACLTFPLIQPWQHPLVVVSSSFIRSRSTAPGIPWSSVILGIIGLGIAAKLVWLGIGLWQLRRFRRSAIPMYSLPQPIREARTFAGADALFCVSKDVAGPATLGFFDPVVLLPASFISLDEDAQRSVACHELIHVRRKDWLVTLLEGVAGSLFWFHPAIWFLLAKAKLTREQVVDGEVVRMNAPGPYIDALLSMAVVSKPRLALPAAPFFTEGHLSHRMRALLTNPRRSLTRLCISYACIAAVLVSAGWSVLILFPLNGEAQVVTAAVPKLATYQVATSGRRLLLPASSTFHLKLPAPGGETKDVVYFANVEGENPASGLDNLMPPPPPPPPPPGPLFPMLVLGVRALRPGQVATPEEIQRFIASFPERSVVQVIQGKTAPFKEYRSQGDPQMQRCLILLVLVFSAALLGQPQQQQQAQQTGSIEGSIVKFGTTDAIPRAKVTLRPSNSPNSQAVTADDGGKFTFRDLAPGQYRITVTRDGYVAGEYGQRSPGSSGVPVNLGTQQQFKDARIALVPSGTISGRIVNRYGEPVGNANVQALRYTYQDGRRSLTPFQNIRTNDLGEYRLFWMQPGQYIISAQGTDSVVVDPGGTIMFTSSARGPAGILGPGGPQLGVGGVTRITVTGGGPGPADFVGGPGMPPPPPPPPPPGAVVDDSNISLPVYFPGTLDVTAATPVDLRAGGNVGGVNLTVLDARPVKIRGQVLNGGRPASGAQVSMYQRNNTSGTMTIRSAPVNNDTGAFEFRNVAPGGYELVATLNGFGPGAMILNTPLGNAAGVNAANVGVGRGGRVPGAPVMGARAQVDVNNTDVEGVSLLLETGFNVNGRVAVEGQSANSTANLTNVRVQLQSDPQIPPLSIPAVNPQADGSFSVEGVTPGTYTLNVAGLPSNTYLKSARLAGVDVLNGGFRIDNSPGSALDIILGSSPGTVDATVVDDRQMPIAAVTVAIVPASAAQEKRYSIYRSATTDSSGKIHLDGVVPGDYKIYAWESVESGAWTDPNFMRAYQNNGTAIRVTEGGRAAADIRVIPYRLN